MKSIIFGIGCLLAVLVVGADNYFFNTPKTTSTIPYNFSYSKVPQSLLLMEITLKNIPPSVTAVTVTQFGYDDSYGTPQKDTFDANMDKKTREGKFMILLSLTQDQIWVVVKLLNVGGELCYETKIIEGRETKIDSYREVYYCYWDTTNNRRANCKYSDWKHDVSQTCLAPKACEMILDLKDTCKEKPKSTYGENVECNKKESQYICTFVRAANNYFDLLLSQNYEDESVIGPIWKITSGTTKLSIKLELELFDNNTSVKLAPEWAKTITTLRSDTLRITAQDISNHSSVTTLKYTNTTDVQFSCKQYEQSLTIIYVGFINTTDNKITTHDTTIMETKKIMKADNGTILCCIVYECNWQGMTITRFVKNKTLLIYQTQESTSTNLTVSESNEQKKPSCQDVWWFYLLLTLFGSAILLLTFYIVKKQCWYTKSQPAEETVELDNYATTNEVLYANLDLVHNEGRAEVQTEESPYANIIGELHPL